MFRHCEDWSEKDKFDDAEKHFLELEARSLSEIDGFSSSAKASTSDPSVEEEKPLSSLLSGIASARKLIESTLKSVESGNFDPIADLNEKYKLLEERNKKLEDKVVELEEKIQFLIKCNTRFDLFIGEIQNKQKFNLPIEHCNAKPLASPGNASDLKKGGSGEPNANDDDDIDLFQSDEEESEEVSRLKEERLQAYETKKSGKTPVIAKSFVVFDVKPWSDETDLNKMESEVRKIGADGLKWGASKFVPIAFGIKALQIAVVIEDEKISTDWLQETIEELRDHVQSVDIVTFNKV